MNPEQILRNMTGKRLDDALICQNPETLSTMIRHLEQYTGPLHDILKQSEFMSWIICSTLNGTMRVCCAVAVALQAGIKYACDSKNTDGEPVVH